MVNNNFHQFKDLFPFDTKVASYYLFFLNFRSSIKVPWQAFDTIFINAAILVLNNFFLLFDNVSLFFRINFSYARLTQT